MRYRPDCAAAIHQISGTSSRARTIPSPALHPNAVANIAELESGPFTHHLSGECGSVVVLFRFGPDVDTHDAVQRAGVGRVALRIRGGGDGE